MPSYFQIMSIIYSENHPVQGQHRTQCRKPCRHWTSLKESGGIDNANRRGWGGGVHQSNNVGIPGGSCHPTGHGSWHRSTNGLLGETSMELDEELEDTHRYPPSGFLNPLALPEPKGNPFSCFPNLHGMVTHRDSHPGIFQGTGTSRSPD